MSDTATSTSVEAAPYEAASRAEVARSYLGRVILPAVLMVVMTIALTFWFFQTHTVSEARVPIIAALFVAVLGWLTILWGLATTGERFRLDREHHSGNGARGWQGAGWILFALLALYGVGIVLGMAALVMLAVALSGANAGL